MTAGSQHFVVIKETFHLICSPEDSAKKAAYRPSWRCPGLFSLNVWGGFFGLCEGLNLH